MTAALDLLTEAVTTHGHLSLSPSPLSLHKRSTQEKEEKEQESVDGERREERREIPRTVSLHQLSSIAIGIKTSNDIESTKNVSGFLGLDKKTPRMGGSSTSLPDVCALSLSEFRSMDEDLSDIEFDNFTDLRLDKHGEREEESTVDNDVQLQRLEGEERRENKREEEGKEREEEEEGEKRVSGSHEWSDGRPHFHENCPCLSSSLLLLLSRLLNCLLPPDILSQWCCNRNKEEMEKEECAEGEKEKKVSRVCVTDLKIPTRVSVASSALAALTQFAAMYFPCFWFLLLSSRSLSPFSPSPSSSPSPSLVSSSLSSLKKVTLLEVIVEIYSRQTDPLLRGHVSSLCGQVISSLFSSPSPLLTPSSFSSSTLPTSLSPFPCSSESEFGNLIRTLFAHILKALDDPSATTSKLAIRGLSLSLPSLSVSRYSSLSLTAVRSLLLFPSATYWLVKKEILSVLGTLNFSALKKQQQQRSSEDLTSQMSSDILFHSEGMGYTPDIQDDVISFVLTQLIDSDYRVRSAASECVVEMVPLLCSDSQVRNGYEILMEK